MDRKVSAREQRARDKAAWEQAQRAWGRTPRERREALLFQALGDEALIIREIAERMNHEAGFSRRFRAIGNYEVQPLVNRMFRNGQLDREPETFNKTHTRYRYRRQRELDGPIAELERAYNDDNHDDSEAVA